MLAELSLANEPISLEYKLAPQMVIFSHGFGVQRDSLGMFTDIASALPKGTGYVLFDYNVINTVQRTVRAVGFTEQVARLKAVIAWTRQQTGVTQIDLVGHSLGCLIIADLAPEDISKIILLAPPTTPLNAYRRERYTKKPGAKFEKDTWFVPRRDGATIIVAEKIFDELKQVDSEGELTKLALLQPYTLIIAEADEVLTDDDYTELITMKAVTSFGIANANHLFANDARPELVETVIQQLSEVLN